MKKLLTIATLGCTTLAFGYYEPSREYYGNQMPHSYQQYRTEGSEQPENTGMYSQSRNYTNAKPNLSRGEYNSIFAKGENDDDDDDNDDDDDDDDDDDKDDNDKDVMLADIIRNKLADRELQIILVDVNEGSVTLRGSVDSGEKRIRVERALQTIHGIRNIQNRIEVKKPSSSAAYAEGILETSERKYPHDKAATKEDRFLNARIREKINGTWFAPINDTLTIRTNHGDTLISGLVDSKDDIAPFGHKVASVEGVRALDNQMKAKN